MKKILLTTLGIAAIMGVFAYSCTLANRTEVMTCVSIDDDNVVTFEDADGYLWEYEKYSAEIGKEYKVTLHDNDTVNIFDDFIVEIAPVEK